MADKVDKPKKKAKGKKDEQGVLAALPSTRPQRIGGRRAAGSSAPAPKSTSATAASKAAAEPATAAKRSRAAKAPAASAKRSSSAKAPAASAKRATRGKAAARPKAAASRAKASSSSGRTTAARRKAAAPRTFEPTQAAESAAGAADERAAGAIPLSETARRRTGDGSYPRPRPVREGAPGIGTTGYRDRPDEESGRPGGVELANSAVRAAGEVAQLGLTIGGQVLKRVVDRLPKP